MPRMSFVSGLAVLLCAGLIIAEEEPPAQQAGKKHEFLRKFTGNWVSEVEAYFEPGKPPLKSRGTMAGQMLGDYWAILVVKGDAAGQPYQGQASFGYDSQKEKYIGTWADSTSEFLWQYEGTVDGTKLVLHTMGPSPGDPAKRIKAVDTWDFKSADLIVLTSQMESSDGKLVTIMTATCTRKK